MQDLRRLMVLLCLLLGQARAAEVVRLITWNLEWFPGRKPAASQQERDRHFREIATALPQLRADIVVLQEVRNADAAERLARVLPGFTVHVVSRFKDAVANAVGEQQIAIMSRFAADAAWAEAWKRGWANAPRGYAYAKLAVSGHSLHVYGLHLKSNLGTPVENTSKREDAMEQLLSHIGSQVQAREAVVVAGDFNTSKEQVSLAADTTLLKIEHAGFFWAFEGIPLEHRITVPGKGRYPDACFDHVYARGLGRPTAAVIEGFPGSDHFPVASDLQIGAGP